MAIGQEIEAIGQLMQDAISDIEKSNAAAKPMAARLIVMRSIAGQLREPAQRIRNFGNEFTRQLHDVDDGVRLLIDRAPDEALENEEARVVVCRFFGAMIAMAESANQSLSSLQEMIDSMKPLEAMSRDLRPVLRSLREGLTLMVEGREVIGEWVRLIEASPVNCGDVTA